MNKFLINRNDFLSRQTTGYFHTQYTRMGNPGNPDYLNFLKNTFNDFPRDKLRNAMRELADALQSDLQELVRLLDTMELVACVTPRAKSEGTYQNNQQLFRATVRLVVQNTPGL